MKVAEREALAMAKEWDAILTVLVDYHAFGAQQERKL